MNWNKCHSLLQFIMFIFKYLKFSHSIQFVKKKKKKNTYLLTHTQNSESGDIKQNIFLRMVLVVGNLQSVGAFPVISLICDL